MEKTKRRFSVGIIFGRCLALLGALLFVVARLSAAPVGTGDDFEAANRLFDEGKYADAKSHYDKLVSAGDWNANLFYDLGNCEFRLGFPGRAILDYERALTLDPSHPEAQANLTLLRSQTGAKTETSTWRQYLIAGRSQNVWIIIGTAAAWAAIFGIAALATTRRRETAGLWFITILGVAVFGYAGTIVWLQYQDRDAAVVTEKSADFRFGITDTAQLAETLPAGSRVRVISERDDWVYCELPGDTRAWAPQRAVERIRIEKL